MDTSCPAHAGGGMFARFHKADFLGFAHEWLLSLFNFAEFYRKTA
jgi:hypothetical protein